jgi:RNA polymerase sigma-70 factor, ECF subfamily
MAAIDDLVQAHGPALLAYATRLTGGDHHSAEDVVQETWLRAWRHIGRLTNNRGSVRGWLLRVAHNIAMDQHRNRRARPTEVELPDQEVPGAPTVPPPSDAVDTRVVVNSALDNLSHVHRITLVEVYLADRTATSAASVLGVPVGTVKSRVYNALHTLRTVFPRPRQETAGRVR